ncbi:MAG: response regulator [Calditrichia bacterium]
MLQKHILLAEDNEQDMELTLMALKKANLNMAIEVVRDGQEALEYVFKRGRFVTRQTGDPIVILLDLKMPRINGLEVLEQIKSDPGAANIPVVMLTSSREEIDKTKSYSLGVNAYVVKPVDYKKFSDSLKQLGHFWAHINEVPA